MSCSPSYNYRPQFTPGTTPCAAPVYATSRSRCTTAEPNAQPLFFRSKHQNNDANNLAVELVPDGYSTALHIRFNGVIVKTYGGLTPNINGQIAALRAQFDNDPNDYVEMPPVGLDIHDARTVETDGDNATVLGLAEFPLIQLTGGQGAPTTADAIAGMRTGPERTICIIQSEEDITGAPVAPPASHRVQQWNGSMWISYCNLVPGVCPGEGTC